MGLLDQVVATDSNLYDTARSHAPDSQVESCTRPQRKLQDSGGTQLQGTRNTKEEGSVEMSLGISWISAPTAFEPSGVLSGFVDRFEVGVARSLPQDRKPRATASSSPWRPGGRQDRTAGRGGCRGFLRALVF